mgnify:CR=1 FL=1
MDKLRAMQLFVRLADLGSFTKVAEQQNSSKSLISKEISRLEASMTDIRRQNSRASYPTSFFVFYLCLRREDLTRRYKRSKSHRWDFELTSLLEWA